MIPLPVMDKNNNPVRDADGNLIYAEKVVMPSEWALEFELDRLDLVGPVEAEMPEQAQQSKAEIEAEEARYVDLFTGAIDVLVKLGVPLPQPEPPAIAARATNGAAHALRSSPR
ncbi:MAG: hypothetical protein ACREPW_02830 [Candidatus Binataceae bacterium]